MAKIIVFGDIDIASLYIRIDDGKEITVSGKYPQSFSLTAGSHEIAATTVSKLERITQGWGGDGFLSAATAALQDGTNTTVGGVLTFAEDDVLLIEVEQKGLKTKVYNKMVPESEAAQYVDVNAAVTYGEGKTKKGKKKLKWLPFLLGGLIVVLVFLVLFVFMVRTSG